MTGSSDIYKYQPALTNTTSYLSYLSYSDSHLSFADILEMEVQIVQAKTNKPVVTLPGSFSADDTVGDIKRAIGAAKTRFQDVNRQELRAESKVMLASDWLTHSILTSDWLKGKGLKDEETLGSLGLTDGSVTLYLKDRGVQIGKYLHLIC